MIYPRVLCMGEVLLDCLADQVGRPWPEVKSWTSYPGGAPANVACALAKLGTAAGFIGCVGQDETGIALVELLKTTGVESTGIQHHPEAPTRKVYVLRSEQGDRTFAGFDEQLATTAFADAFLQAEQLPIQLFDGAEFLVLGTLELAYPDTRAAIYRALELAEQHYLKVVLDVNWRPVFWPQPAAAPRLIYDLIEQADFIKLSAQEAEWLFKTQDPGAIARQLGDIEGVLVTSGEHGCAYYLAGNEGKLPPFPVEVEDTTGAGDGFIAGFIHQLCQRGLASLRDPDAARQMVAYASAVGALTTTRLGAIAGQPSVAEVEAFLYLQQNGH
ncbi:MAG: carbohydrate kinase [Cyanothece sp. SIO1E1]|nr:carbohydrate kinase [Cyanothece sp. SIO1E1]